MAQYFGDGFSCGKRLCYGSGGWRREKAGNRHSPSTLLKAQCGGAVFCDRYLQLLKKRKLYFVFRHILYSGVLNRDKAIYKIRLNRRDAP